MAESTNHKLFHIAPEGEGDILPRIGVAISFAKERNETVLFSFKGTEVYVAPGSTVDEVQGNWNKINKLQMNVGLNKKAL